MKSSYRLFAGLACLLASASAEAQKVQVPPVIRGQVQGIADQFGAVLEEECAEPRCYDIGCEVGRFDTIDETQGSSLPGLDIAEPPSGTVQYKLRSVTCTFSHEASLGNEDLANLKRRLKARVRPGSVSLTVSGRKLPPKATTEDEPQEATPPLARYDDFGTALGATLLPFIPWFLVTLLAALFILAVIWGFRRLGVDRGGSAKGSGPEGDPEGGKGQALAVRKAEQASPFALMAKSDELKKALSADPSLTEATLKPLFDENATMDLCAVVRCFGPELLHPFRGRPQYEKALLELSAAYDAKDQHLNPEEVWDFLGRLERRMIAAKIRIDQQPVAEEFAFLGSLSIDELAGLLQNVSETEAVLAFTYCPRSLREAFFASCPPKLVAAYIEKFAAVDKLPDSYARETARRLRKIYEEEFSSLRTVQIEQVPLLESAINSLKVTDRNALVSDIMRENPDLIRTVSPHIVLDGSLSGMPDDLLTEAFLLVSPKAAAAYLSSFDGGQTILGRLSPKLAETIRKQMQGMNGSFPGLVDEARERISTFVKEKNAEGLIDLGRINAELLREGSPPA